ncbi:MULTISPECIES: hypothetical protein [Anaeromyxobacter]|uniref:hypothetical protein n=1 Tax=Anaeromyxobacter TaxID=161492 RepID=UPI001F58510D|nr:MULTISPECIES: hypothetical protein [unclassified Anaeromyxobacter]
MPRPPQANRQLELFDARRATREAKLSAASRLADSLADILAERVRLTVHDNRSTMVSFRRGPAGLHYRVHHMFLEAPGDVVRALAAFAGPARGAAARRREAGSRIDAFVRHNRARIAVPRADRLQPRGRAHDLQAIYERLNGAHFAGAIEARIGWGPVRGGRRRRTVKTGVYVQDARIIRIHPTLDRPEVPEFYVAMVVFHEMLHQAVPAREVNGRRVVHGAEFRRRERAYPDFTRAKAWEERNLGLLLSAPG